MSIQKTIALLDNYLHTIHHAEDIYILKKHLVYEDVVIDENLVLITTIMKVIAKKTIILLNPH